MSAEKHEQADGGVRWSAVLACAKCGGYPWLTGEGRLSPEIHYECQRCGEWGSSSVSERGALEAWNVKQAQAAPETLDEAQSANARLGAVRSSAWLGGVVRSKLDFLIRKKAGLRRVIIEIAMPDGSVATLDSFGRFALNAHDVNSELPVRRRCRHCNGTGEMDRRCQKIIAPRPWQYGHRQCENLALIGEQYCVMHLMPPTGPDQR